MISLVGIPVTIHKQQGSGKLTLASFLDKQVVFHFHVSTQEYHRLSVVEMLNNIALVSCQDRLTTLPGFHGGGILLRLARSKR